ncbi:MAG TPA: hypothetical protein PKD53_13740 [Chloroflexaceae bacterium]|nr:hypothetical protein [Chloroflexaceae bacterium]
MNVEPFLGVVRATHARRLKPRAPIHHAGHGRLQPACAGFAASDTDVVHHGVRLNPEKARPITLGPEDQIVVLTTDRGRRRRPRRAPRVALWPGHEARTNTLRSAPPLPLRERGLGG